MKRPKFPTKPYPPYKPNPPSKKIGKYTNLGSLTEYEDFPFSLQWFTDHIKENFPNVDPSNVKFSLEVNTERGYYDDISSHINIIFYTIETIDNPEYDLLYKKYQKSLIKYKKDYQNYKKKMIQYKLDEKQYQIDIEIWVVEKAKLTLKKHEEKKLKKAKST